MLEDYYNREIKPLIDRFKKSNGETLYLQELVWTFIEWISINYKSGAGDTARDLMELKKKDIVSTTEQPYNFLESVARNYKSGIGKIAKEIVSEVNMKKNYYSKDKCPFCDGPLKGNIKKGRQCINCGLAIPNGQKIYDKFSDDGASPDIDCGDNPSWDNVVKLYEDNE